MANIYAPIKGHHSSGGQPRSAKVRIFITTLACTLLHECDRIKKLSKDMDNGCRVLYICTNEYRAR